MISPYQDRKPEEWLNVTKRLVKKHPLSTDEIVQIVLDSWMQIFKSRIGTKPYYLGKDIFPKPQIMGFLLHELIPLNLESKYPKKWRKERLARDKDIIYIPDDFYSVEIKTSSDPRSIFGNRSYAQEAITGKKSKSGYYLAINFGKFVEDQTGAPKIAKIRFGWLDHRDWMGQKAATGQQSRLSREVENSKLLPLYPKE